MSTIYGLEQSQKTYQRDIEHMELIPQSRVTTWQIPGSMPAGTSLCPVAEEDRVDHFPGKFSQFGLVVSFSVCELHELSPKCCVERWHPRNFDKLARAMELILHGVDAVLSSISSIIIRILTVGIGNILNH